MRRLMIPFVLAACAGAFPAAAQDRRLDEKIAAVLPTRDEERWLETPWRRELLPARREANEAGKPLFLWLMDGDPLGCT